MRRSLVEIAVAENLIDEASASALEKRARHAGEPVIVALAETVNDVAIAVALARRLRMPIVELSTEPADPEALREVSQDVAHRRRLLPLTIDQTPEGPRTLKVAMADPTDRDALAEVEVSSGCRLLPVLATLSGVEEAIARAYRGAVTAVMRPTLEEETQPSRRIPFGAHLGVATPAGARGGVSGGLGTEPFHAIDDEAPIEVRHRALVELLFAKGLLTPEEYQAEIRRLLRGED